jgi:hypothetical protein
MDKRRNITHNLFIIINKTHTEKSVKLEVGFAKENQSQNNKQGDYKYHRKAGVKQLMAMKYSTEYREITCVN